MIQLRQDSLWYKAIYLIVSIIIFVTIEISLGMWFKTDITQNFERLMDIERRSQEPLVGIWIAAELARELTVPTEGPVFLRTNNWVKRLEQLKHLETMNGDEINAKILASLNNAISDIHQLNADKASVDEFRMFAGGLVKTINGYTKNLHQKVETLTKSRRTLFADFKTTNDLYMFVLLGIGMVGVAIVVVTGGIFLTRLVRSLEQLELRAKRITLGDYTTSMVTDRKDEIGKLVGSINNMATALERQEKEAEEFHQRLSSQEKMFTLGSFAAGIAHEIGNPIQAIMVLIAQIGESLAEDPSQENINKNLDRLDIVTQQVERLSKAIYTIREYTYSGTPDRELVDINANVETATNLLRFDPRFKRVAIDFMLDRNIPPVAAVSDHIVQVVLNLVINACDAVSPEDGKIMITTDYTDGMINISIKDNGHGMAENEKTRATEPFFTTKPRGKGTGLGLSICKDIIEEHDGIIKIDSQVSTGTTVTVKLPAPPMESLMSEGAML